MADNASDIPPGITPLQQAEGSLDTFTGHEVEELGPSEEVKLINAPAFLIELDDYITEDQLPPGEDSSGFAFIHEKGSNEVTLVLPHFGEDGSMNHERYVQMTLPIGALINLSGHLTKALGLRLPDGPLHIDIEKRPKNPFADSDSPTGDESTTGESDSDNDFDAVARLFAGATPVRG